MRRETVITILADRDANTKKRQDVVRPRRRSRFLARRLHKRYVRFFDGGWFANGDESDFNIKPTITELDYIALDHGLNAGDPATYILSVGTFDLVSYYASYASGIDPTTFEARHEITPTDASEYGGGTLPVLTGYITGKGYLYDPSITDIDFLGTNYNGTFSTSGSIGGHSFKVTDTASYSAPSVTFTLDGPCDVFLMPNLWLWQGRVGGATTTADPSYPSPTGDIRDASAYHGIGVARPYKNWLFGNYYKPLPRAASINSTDWDSFIAVANGNVYASLSSGQRTWLRGVFQGDADAREYFYWMPDPASGIAESVDLANISSVGVGTFPTDSYLVPSTSRELAYYPHLFWQATPALTGTCQAIIRKSNGDVFYVWNANDSLGGGVTGGYV